MARIESCIARVETKCDTFHEDLREGTKTFKEHEKRIVSVEKTQERHAAQFRSLKVIGGIISTLIGALLSALHLKHQ